MREKKGQRLMAQGLGTLSIASYVYSVLRQEWMGLHVAGSLLVLSSLKYAWWPQFAPKPVTILDHDKLNEWRQLEENEFQSILNNYRSITPMMMNALEKSVFHKNFDDVQRLSMRLYSSGMAIGAVHFAGLAQRIELLSRQQDEIRLPIALADLYAAYPDIDNALAAVGTDS
ncbi:MAG TPA: hypothetical protein DIS76_04290 [Rhodospirillaceae bacterium]|nr:hypothetical protein [Rhodospirillaceae bacterium]